MSFNPTSIRYDSTDDAGPLKHLGNSLSHLATGVQFVPFQSLEL